MFTTTNVADSWLHNCAGELFCPNGNFGKKTHNSQHLPFFRHMEKHGEYCWMARSCVFLFFCLSYIIIRSISLIILVLGIVYYNLTFYRHIELQKSFIEIFWTKIDNENNQLVAAFITYPNFPFLDIIHLDNHMPPYDCELWV